MTESAGLAADTDPEEEGWPEMYSVSLKNIKYLKNIRVGFRVFLQASTEPDSFHLVISRTSL